MHIISGPRGPRGPSKLLGLAQGSKDVTVIGELHLRQHGRIAGFRQLGIQHSQHQLPSHLVLAQTNRIVYRASDGKSNVVKCNKWFIPPISGDLGDGLLLF